MTLTNETRRYNYSMIDWYDRSVIASVTSSFIRSSQAVRLHEKTLSRAKAIPQNLILHSDQGSQFTPAEFVQHCLKDQVDLSVSFWNCSRTGLFRVRVCLRLVQSGTATTYNGYLTSFENRAERSIKQWCYKKCWPLHFETGAESFYLHLPYRYVI